MSDKADQYLLLFRDSDPDRFKGFSPEAMQQYIQRWSSWYEGLASQGKVTGGHPLVKEGRTVSGRKGEHVVDGPFAESKEAIAGYFLLSVGSMDEATSIAQQCPGLDYGVTVEVRLVAEMCHRSDAAATEPALARS